LYLTPEEEKIYDGEHGWAYEISMKILVRLGDLFGASRLIPIESAHISGVSYKTLGDAPTDFLEALAKAGGKARVFSTLNPSGFDPDHASEMRIPSDFREKQNRILGLYEKMGVDPTLTCTPYYLRKFEQGKHLAWAESSAVVYANSVLNAWTNREGSPSALASALVGKTPDYGVHQAENRRASLLVKVESSLRNETEFGALGIHVGKIAKNQIPIFDGLPKKCSKEELKQLGAALASSGMTPMFHHDRRPKMEKLEIVSVEPKDLKDTTEGLSTASEAPDLIFIGCPHCSLSELQSVAQALKGRKVKRETKLWVCTSRYVKEKAEESVAVIEKAGGNVFCGTCAIVTWTKNLGIDTIMTNSAKTAYYAPTFNGANVILAPLEQCILGACR
jgi:predicted aconitase